MDRAHSPSAHTQPGSAETVACLPPLVGPAGHDAYCHVCWEPVYRFWAAKESPDYSRCGIGDYTAQTCPNATGPARQKAAIARLKAEGLWVGSLGASLAAEATTPASPSLGGDGGAADMNQKSHAAQGGR